MQWLTILLRNGDKSAAHGSTTIMILICLNIIFACAAIVAMPTTIYCFPVQHVDNNDTKSETPIEFDSLCWDGAIIIGGIVNCIQCIYSGMRVASTYLHVTFLVKCLFMVTIIGMMSDFSNWLRNAQKKNDK